MAKDGLHLYVLSMSGDAISSVDTSTNLVVGTLALTVGENPVAMIQSPDGSKRLSQGARRALGRAASRGS